MLNIMALYVFFVILADFVSFVLSVVGIYYRINLGLGFFLALSVLNLIGWGIAVAIQELDQANQDEELTTVAAE